jgi:uncharacterized protein YukE
LRQLRIHLVSLTVLAVLTALPAVGCRTIYYGAMEQIGWEKRHILTDRVEDSRKAQGKAEEQFQSAFDRFKELTQYDGGDLERIYRRLSGELERSEKRALDVRERISSVNIVANDLFEEWERELNEISNRDLRRQSADRLHQTQTRYRSMYAAMRRAESKMEPVLRAFRDQVLFLKHNLNADAIASLESTVSSIETDVQSLINELRNAIREADAFLSSMKG